MTQVTTSLSERLAGCYTGALFDVLREMGHSHQVLPHDIRPLDPAVRVAGPAFTFSGQVGDFDPHETLLAWTGLLSAAPPGSVLVCQPNDDRLAHMGELSAETLQFKGVRGYVVDGGCRDTDFIIRLGFGVFSRYTTPRDIVGRWIPVGIGKPITIGGVGIATGDLVLADRDGVVILDTAVAEEAIARTEVVMATENKVRVAILNGVDPQEAYLRHGKF